MRAVPSLALSGLALLGTGGCAAKPVPCPTDASSYLSVSVERGAWDDPFVHPSSGSSASPTCKSLVAGPFLSPNYGHVGWVEDRGDHQVFVVDGRPVTRLRGDLSFLSVGLDGSRMWYLHSPTLQMFVHEEGEDDDLHWKAAIECPSCRSGGGTRYFDVRPSGPLEYAESADGAFTFLTVPGRSAHTKIFVLDTKTPENEPTADRYLSAADDAANGEKLRFGSRVWIGGSEGPVFDAVRLDSFSRDAGGSIHYEGARGNAVYDVVDNVLGAKLAGDVPVRAE